MPKNKKTHKRSRLECVRPSTLKKWADIQAYFSKRYEERDARGARMRYEDALRLTAEAFYISTEHVQFILRQQAKH